MSLSNIEFSLFRNYIRDICGMELEEEKAYLIETRLSKMLADSGFSTFGELYKKIISCNNSEYREKIIDAITTNETLWFRDKNPWLILEEHMPVYIEKIRSGQSVRIWSAASSTGQEAYSTAICIAEYLNSKYITDVTLNDFEILATDISKEAVEIAKKGRYGNLSLIRGLSPALKEKYFENKGAVWEIKQNIKDAVGFRKFNLQNSFALLGKFDVVFLRYVMIYLTKTFKEELLEKMYNVLNDDGIMFLGAYEFFEILNDHFNSHSLFDSSYYKKKQD